MKKGIAILLLISTLLCALTSCSSGLAPKETKSTEEISTVENRTEDKGKIVYPDYDFQK